MTFPKFHGIELARGSHVSNMNLEQLDQDPVALTDGRLWLDKHDDKIKYASFSEATGELSVLTVATEESVQITETLLTIGASIINTQAMLLANSK